MPFFWCCVDVALMLNAKTPVVLKYHQASCCFIWGIWLRELDLNQRPSGYEPDELPNCSIPQMLNILAKLGLQVMTLDGRKKLDGMD